MLNMGHAYIGVVTACSKKPYKHKLSENMPISPSLGACSQKTKP